MLTEENLTFVVQSSSSSKWMSPPKSPAILLHSNIMWSVVAWLKVVDGCKFEPDGC